MKFLINLLKLGSLKPLKEPLELKFNRKFSLFLIKTTSQSIFFPFAKTVTLEPVLIFILSVSIDAT